MLNISKKPTKRLIAKVSSVQVCFFFLFIFIPVTILFILPFAAAIDYTVSVTTTGDGYVESYPAGILCGAACSENFANGREITLTVRSNAGASFTGWSGDCSGSSPTCSFVLDADKTVKATFSGTGGSAVKLKLIKEGDGIGSVFSQPDGIECSAICGSDSYSFTIDSTVTLTATAKEGYSFAGWSGDCSQSGSEKSCTLTMNTQKSISAKFIKQEAAASAPVTAPVSTPSHTAEPQPGQQTQQKIVSRDYVQLPTVPVQTVPQAQQKQQQKIPKKYRLNIAPRGTGNFVVNVHKPASYNCQQTCIPEFEEGSKVELSITTGQNTQFLGWDGACAGMQKTCTITMDSDKTVIAQFERKMPDAQLVIYKNILHGKIEAVSLLPQVSQQSLSCGDSCKNNQAKFVHGTVMTLFATVPKGYFFGGWSADCAGYKFNLTCTLILDNIQKIAGAEFYPYYDQLSVSKTGAGAGTVTSPDAKISCGSYCATQYPSNSLVTLTAAPAQGSLFDGWSGDCSGKQTTCTVTVENYKNVVATFTAVTTEKIKYKLTVGMSGVGTSDSVKSIVTSRDSGIHCGEDCSQEYEKDSQIVLHAVTDENIEFVGWGGACIGSYQTCTVIMDNVKSVFARFREKPKQQQIQKTVYRTLVVNRYGSGNVKSSDTKINCGTDCYESYATTAVSTTENNAENKTAYPTMTLTAVPLEGYVFKNWSGDCATTLPSCALLLDKDKTATALFVPEPPKSYRLTLYKTPSSSATNDLVISSDKVINCGTRCSMDIATGKKITLEAIPAAGRELSSWGVDCFSTDKNGKCELTMDSHKTVSANFREKVVEQKSRKVTVKKQGTGSGTVSSANEIIGIDCGEQCQNTYHPETKLLLAHRSASDSVFTSWSGDCVKFTNFWGSFCELPATESDQVAIATFAKTYPIKVKVDNKQLLYGKVRVRNGKTTIIEPCNNLCEKRIKEGESITITADKYDRQATFVALIGDCLTKEKSCTLTMDGAKTVEALFLPKEKNMFKVIKTGSGSGKVKAIHGSIDCGTNCEQFYPDGGVDAVTLKAIAAIGSEFKGWDIDCAGTDLCSATIASSSKLVTAQFEKVPPKTLVVKRTGIQARIITADGVVNCDKTQCNYTIPFGTELTLTVTNLQPRTQLNSWDGCDNASASCTIKMDKDRTVEAKVGTYVPRGPGAVGNAAKTVYG